MWEISRLDRLDLSKTISSWSRAVIRRSPEIRANPRLRHQDVLVETLSGCSAWSRWWAS